MSKTIDQIKDAINNPTSLSSPVTDDMLLSTGSTLLNLACSSRLEGGFCKGRYFYLVGDSDSGKTFLSLTCFAEALANPNFSNYRLIYDDVEGGALMDLEKFFGLAVKDKIEAPGYDEDGDPIYSDTIEDFYFNVDDALSNEQPCIYVLDSMDGLTSDAEIKKFGERKEANRKGKEAKGEYTDGKAKRNSSGIRTCLSRLRDTGSILIVISQTRDDPAAGPFAPSQTHSGGKSLKFYATVQLWSSKGKTINKNIKGKDRQIGIISKISVKKNRLSGRANKVEIPILHSYGIDDMSSCIDYLLTEGVWKMKGTRVEATGIGPTITEFRDKLINKIEIGNLEGDVRELVAQTWWDIETAMAAKRKKRYV